MSKVVRNLIILLLLGLSALFAFLAYKEEEPVIKSKAQQEAIKEIAVLDNSDPYNRIIDFQTLRTLNEDIVGWLYIPDSSIDYPILIGDTDSEYLNKDVEGNWSELGSIFCFKDTNKNLFDANTFLFGHNMLEYQMFGELRRYFDKDFRDSHKKVYIYTETRTLELEVFSIFTCLSYDELFSNRLELGSLEYQDLLVSMENRNSLQDLEITGSIKDMYNNRMFSLVTCHGDVGTVYRLVINAITVREKYIL